MMSCSQLIEIEDLVLGTIEPARAKELREHVAGCTACRLEQAAVIKERALFTHRAEVLSDPPPAIAALLRVQLTAEVDDPTASRARPGLRGSRVGPARRGAERLVRGGSNLTRALGQVLRRGHVSAAFAAFLFALVAFSKLGGAPILPQPESDRAGEGQAGGATASFSALSRADETLACQQGSMTSTRGDQLVSAGATTQTSSSHLPSMHGALACDNESSQAICEPEPCSSLPH